MRFLLSYLMLLCSCSLRAQMAADMFLAGGYAIPAIRDERSPASYHEKGYYLAHGVDFLINESRTFFPYAGLRISQQRFRSAEQFSNGKKLLSDNQCIALSAVGGVQYAHDLAKHTSLRVALGAGPFFDVEGRSQRGSAFNAVAEASVGLKWRFVTLGVKLVKPFGAFGQSAYGLDGEGTNNYDVSIAALELKLTPPPRPTDGKHGRPNGPRGPSDSEPGRERKARVELGVAVGPAMVKVSGRGSRDSDPAGSGAIGLVTFDVYGDANRRPLCVAAGGRIGADPFGAHISHVVGFQINTAPKKDVAFRLSAMGGPLIYNTARTPISLNLILEGNANLLINHRWSVGLKYMQPIEDLDDIYSKEPWFGSAYRVRYLMGEVKVRFGRR